MHQLTFNGNGYILFFVLWKFQFLLWLLSSIMTAYLWNNIFLSLNAFYWLSIFIYIFYFVVIGFVVQSVYSIWNWRIDYTFRQEIRVCVEFGWAQKKKKLWKTYRILCFTRDFSASCLLFHEISLHFFSESERHGNALQEQGIDYHFKNKCK